MAQIDTCPYDHKRLWADNGPINERLTAVFTPLSEAYSTTVGHLALYSEKTREHLLANSGRVFVNDYGPATSLPPALFGTITEDEITPSDRLLTPNSEYNRLRSAKSYSKWVSLATKNVGIVYSEYPNTATLFYGMGRLQGQSYDPESWLRAAHNVQEELRNPDKIFTYDSHSTDRLNNASRFHTELEKTAADTHVKYPNYVLCFNNSEPESSYDAVRKYVQLPVGEYGGAAAEKLARATMYLIQQLNTNDVVDATYKSLRDPGVEELLARHTARSRDRKIVKSTAYGQEGTANTLAEGILSIAQVLTLLTSEKIEGYDNHDDLVHAVLTSNLIEQFTRSVRPGYIGPTTLGGIKLPHPISNDTGHLKLTTSTIEYLHTAKKQYLSETVAKWALYHSSKSRRKPQPAVLGLVCPAAVPNGALTILKQAFMHFYSDANAPEASGPAVPQSRVLEYV